MTRRNRNDNLTINRNKSKNWLLNFRVPESHRHLQPFRGRQVYQCSTGTSDYKLACKFRDDFFIQHDLFQPELTTPPNELYWRTFSGSEPVSDEEYERLIEVSEDTIGAGTRLPEPYASRIDGHKNHLALVRNPSAEVEHRYPLNITALHSSYLDYRGTDLSAKTISRSIRAITAFNTFVGSDDFDFTKVNKKLVFRFIQQLETKQLSSVTIKGYVSALGLVFDYSQRMGYVVDDKSNPFKGQQIRSIETSTPRNTMPLHYAVSLFDEATDKQLNLLIAIGHYTGVRLSEAYSGVIEINGDQVSLRVADDGGKTKAATRQIPIHDHLWEILQESRMLDTETGKIRWTAPNSDSLGKRFGHFKRRYFEGIGVDDKPYVFHSFRHAFSTYLVNSFSELKASELTGHDRGSSSATELGRTYYKGLGWEEKKVMIQSLPLLQSHT